MSAPLNNALLCSHVALTETEFLRGAIQSGQILPGEGLNMAVLDEVSGSWLQERGLSFNPFPLRRRLNGWSTPTPSAEQPRSSSCHKRVSCQVAFRDHKYDTQLQAFGSNHVLHPCANMLCFYRITSKLSDPASSHPAFRRMSISSPSHKKGATSSSDLSHSRRS